MRLLASLLLPLLGFGATISPGSATLKAGQSQQFTTSGVCTNWFLWASFNGQPAIGSISSAGIYTAPSIVPSNYYVVVDCGNLYVDAVIHLQQSSTGVVGVSVSPTQVTLTPGQQQQFTTSVSTSGPTGLAFQAAKGRLPDPQVVHLDNPTSKPQVVSVKAIPEPILNQGHVDPWLVVRPARDGFEVQIVHTDLEPGIYKAQVQVSGAFHQTYHVELLVE